MLGPFAGQRIRQLSAKVKQEDLLELKGLIEAGKIKPVIDRTYPLAAVPDAMRHLEAGHARGKVVIIC